MSCQYIDAVTGEDEFIDNTSAQLAVRSPLWPVTVSAGSLVAVALKGSATHPITFPKPVVTVVQLAVPSVKMHEGSAAAAFESSIMTLQVTLSVHISMHGSISCR